MSTSVICPVCYEAAVIVDTSGDQECKVCAECGTVVDEHAFTSSTPSWISDGYQDAKNLHQNAPKHLKRVHAVSKPEGLLVGCKRVKKIASRFMGNSEMIAAAVSLYEKAYDNPEFKHILVSNKMILSDCCVFVVGRQNYTEVSLTMKEFCLLTKQSIYDFATICKQLLAVFEIQLPYQSMGCVIRYYMSKGKFQQDLVNLVTDIVSLCQDSLLKSSSHRDILVLVAAYLAWSSHNLVENKGKVLTIKQFAKKFNFEYSKSVTTRLKEVTDHLSSIGQNLPWAACQDKKHFVQYNLKDILKYKRSLMFEQMLKDEDDSVLSCKDGDDAVLATCKDDGNAGSLKRPSLSDSKDVDEGQQLVKRSKVTLNGDSEDSDTEILAREVDENISEYIRSEDDVQKLLKSGFME